MSINYTANDIQTLDFRTAIRSRIFALKFQSSNAIFPTYKQTQGGKNKWDIFIE